METPSAKFQPGPDDIVGAKKIAEAGRKLGLDRNEKTWIRYIRRKPEDHPLPAMQLLGEYRTTAHLLTIWVAEEIRDPSPDLVPSAA